MSGKRGAALRMGVLLGMVALAMPSTVRAQTAEERARELVLRSRIEERLQELQELQELRLTRLQERLQRAEANALSHERLADRQARLQEMEFRLQESAENARLVGQEAQELARDRLRQAQDQLRQAQEVMVRVRSRVRMGVSLDAQQGEEYDRRGARIQSVLDDSPADDAGLREGDIITDLNGQSLLEPLPGEEDRDFDPNESLPVQRLMALAQALEPGDEVEVGYLRDDVRGSVSFEVADVRAPVITVLPRGGDLDELRIRIPDLEMDSLRLHYPRIQSFSWDSGETPLLLDLRRETGVFGFAGSAGLQLAEMNPGLAEYFSTDQGVLVLNVPDDSKLGLEPGDVLLSVDGREVDDPSDVRRILSSYEADEAIGFQLVRKGREMTVEGAMG